MDINKLVLNEVETIRPLDCLEESHLNDSVRWIKSGEPIFRIRKPDVPNKHLVSYSVLVDPNESAILLVDHIIAKLWLPCGGHVEESDNPKYSATRELKEELSIEPCLLFDNPIFITQAITVGLTSGHTDVSLWYVFKGNSQMNFNFDKTEFNSVKWFPFDDIPFEKSDPNMSRFIKKLVQLLRGDE